METRNLAPPRAAPDRAAGDQLELFPIRSDERITDATAIDRSVGIAIRNGTHEMAGTPRLGARRKPHA